SGQSGRPVAVESRKKKPFDPESMKLDPSDWPLKTVVKLPAASVVNTFADPRPLLDCVPIPNVSDPVSDAVPPDATDGSCISTPDACSPASLTSAVRTGPHVKPSWNCAHSTIGLPSDADCCGRLIVSALERTRSPLDPVSTRMPPIVWQVDVPGTHTVTLV